MDPADADPLAPDLIIATVLMLVGLIAYLTLYSLFVEPIPGAHARVVRGYVCTADAARVYGDACPDLPREALAGAEWEAVEGLSVEVPGNPPRLAG